MPRLAAVLVLALAMIAAPAACVATERTASRGRAGDLLGGFAHLASGEWTTTLASGDILRETWRWEPDGRSLRVLGVGDTPDGRPWREEQVFFIDEADGTVRVRGSNSYRNGRFEGTVVLGEGGAESQMVIEQSGWERRLVRRWRFEGEDQFTTELLEWLPGEGLSPLASWTYTRGQEPTAPAPSP